MLPSLDLGGVERGVIDLARAMKKQGHEAIVMSSGGALVAELQKMNVTHYTLPIHKKSVFSLGLVSKIAQIIEKERIDVVHARSRVPAWLGWFAARKALVPFVTTCHGYYKLHPLSQIMGWGKRVIVISNIVGRHMMDDFGVPPERIRLIHRGVDLTQFKPKTVEFPVQQRPKRIINVGRLSRIKGQVEFLKAVHKLRYSYPNIEVFLVGSEGKGKHKYTEAIQETIRHLGLQNCVKLLGTRRDVPALLADSDVLVLSTLVPEAFGRVVVEAGAVGTPVIATRAGGVLDIIDDGENGLLVPPSDVPAMAEAMAKVLKDSDLAEKFTTNLRRKVENQFTLEQMTQKTLEVYDELKKEKKILIFKLGAAGDVILSVPTLRMLREKYPNAHISVMVDKKFTPLISNVPYVNEIIPVDRKKLSARLYLLRIAKRIRKGSFDVSVDLQNSKWTHLLAYLGAIPERFGFKRGFFGFLLNRFDTQFNAKESPVQNQFRLLSKMGIRKIDDRLELWSDAQTDRKIADMFPEEFQAPEGKTIGLVLGSSPAWPTKRWPSGEFAKLSAKLIQEFKAKIILIGAKEDESLLSGFNLGSDHVMNLVGKTSLLDLISLMKRVDVLVTGDTAPLHVASATKTKIVALFGPTDPRRHMPPGNGAIVLSRSLPCQPCYSGKCKNAQQLACLTQITVDEVFQAVKRQISQIQEETTSAQAKPEVLKLTSH